MRVQANYGDTRGGGKPNARMPAHANTGRRPGQRESYNPNLCVNRNEKGTNLIPLKHTLRGSGQPAADAYLREHLVPLGSLSAIGLTRLYSFFRSGGSFVVIIPLATRRILPLPLPWSRLLCCPCSQRIFLRMSFSTLLPLSETSR